MTKRIFPKSTNIPDVDTLRATRPIGSHGTVSLDRHYSDYATGSRTMHWDPTSTAADDGGSIIAVTRVSVGRWRELGQTECNAHNYGAVGDGVRDDTDALQATLDAAAALGLPVHIPAGVYLVHTHGDFGSALTVGANDLTIRGDGIDTTIIKLTTSTGNPHQVIRGDWQDRCTIRDLTIDGNRAVGSQSTHGLWLETCEDWLVERVKITGCRGTALEITGGSGHRVLNCLIEDWGAGTEPFPTGLRGRNLRRAYIGRTRP